MTALRDDGDGAWQELLIEMVGDGVDENVVLCHGAISDGDGDLAVPVTFVSEELGNGLGIFGVGGKAVAGLGGVDHELAGRERGKCKGDSIGLGDFEYLHEGIVSGGDGL